MNIITTRAERRQLARDNKKMSTILQPLAKTDWPENLPDGLVNVWRSRDFLVQEYSSENSPRRLAICRTSVDTDIGRWQDGITWDDIQRLKREAGYGNIDAVEIYPNDRDIVNVAAIRHIWLMDEPIAFAWRKRI